MPGEGEQAIRARAYVIWEREGRPDGKDVDHWLRAEAEITSVGGVDRGALMAPTIIMQGAGWGGAGWTIARTDHANTAIPYGGVDRPDGQRNHGFIELNDRPELATAIPEAQDSIGMLAILQALAAPGFRFMSLGCARGLFPRHDAKPGEPTYLYGGYVQVAYRDSALNTNPDRFVALSQRILRGIGPSVEHHTIGFEMIVEPLRSFFGAADCYALIVKPLGYGNSEGAALAAWEHAATAVAAVFIQLQSDPSPLSTSPPDQ